MQISDFESALTRLENIVSELEKGNISLHDSTKLYTEGIMLAQECTNKLADAEKLINNEVTSNGQ